MINPKWILNGTKYLVGAFDTDTNKFIVEPVYDGIYLYENENPFAVVKSLKTASELYGIVRLADGKLIIDCIFNSIYYSSENGYIVMYKDNIYNKCIIRDNKFYYRRLNKNIYG